MSKTIHEERARIAREAFEQLGGSPSQRAVLQVQCDSAHHVGAVYDTEAGLVFHAVLHSKAHGRKDYEDVGHKGTQLGLDWFDLLEPGADPTVSDELAAGCECGPYTLSRRDLLKDIARGERRVVIK